jgi:hypothetical protein
LSSRIFILQGGEPLYSCDFLNGSLRRSDGGLWKLIDERGEVMGYTREMWIKAEIERLSKEIIHLQDRRNELYIELDQITSEEK